MSTLKKSVHAGMFFAGRVAKAMASIKGKNGVPVLSAGQTGTRDIMILGSHHKKYPPLKLSLTKILRSNLRLHFHPLISNPSPSPAPVGLKQQGEKHMQKEIIKEREKAEKLFHEYKKNFLEDSRINISLAIRNCQFILKFEERVKLWKEAEALENKDELIAWLESKTMEALRLPARYSTCQLTNAVNLIKIEAFTEFKEELKRKDFL